MNATIEIWMPVHPAIFAVFLGLMTAYLIYVIAKFVISVWTGA